MALFGKLFEKKECAICGGEIGLLGNRKLEDGNCCKNCAAKLSPWFSDRRQSTVEEIKEQLAYREANQEKVAAFRVTRTLGEGMKVLLDEDDGRFMVTSARNWQEEGLDSKQRAANVAGAFALKEKGENALRSLRSVLLVDDIYTTGATLEACGDILCRTGVQEVYFVCLCIGKD